MTHANQRRTDKIAILWKETTMIANGYYCSKCGKPVFPLGSVLPYEMLDDKVKEILQEKCSAKFKTNRKAV